jgi:hypothetical protein
MRNHSILFFYFGEDGKMDKVETNREHFFGDALISDTIALLTYDGHPRKECRLFKETLNKMSYSNGQLIEWLDSPKDPRFNW